MIPDITLERPRVIEFGAGKIETLKEHLEGCRRIFLLADLAVKDRAESAVAELRRPGVEVRISTDVVPEPPFSALEKLLGTAGEFEPDVVVGVGGGAAMDLAKLVAVLFRGTQKVEEILGIDNLEGRAAKLITVSTTSGTGSEVTPIAVLTDTEHKLKKGAVSKYLIPGKLLETPLHPSILARNGLD